MWIKTERGALINTFWVKRFYIEDADDNMARVMAYMGNQDYEYQISDTMTKQEAESYRDEIGEMLHGS